MTYPDLRDDPSISDETVLWRCIPEEQVVPDEMRGRLRPTSAAFIDNRDGEPMSVYIASECEGEEHVRPALPGTVYITAFTTGLARACGQGVVRDPASGGPGHAVVVGDKNLKVDYEGKRKRTREVLALASRWVLGPVE